MLKPTPPKACIPSKAGNELSGICGKCSHRKSCKKPCIFVEKYLSLNNRKPFEKDVKDILTVLFPRLRREIRECEMGAYEDGKPNKQAQAAFSDENESAFLGTDHRLKQTGIFIDRFFFAKSYGEIAEKYGTTKGGVAKLYVNAKRRLVKTVEAMDRVELAKNNGKPLVDMPKAMRVFLLHALFGLSNAEICRLLGTHHSLVNRQIIKNRERLLCGKINLLSYSGNDA